MKIVNIMLETENAENYAQMTQKKEERERESGREHVKVHTDILICLAKFDCHCFVILKVMIMKN